MKIAVISANLGGYEKPTDWPAFSVIGGVKVDVHRFTDENFPPRPLAMTSRLQAGIPKWFGRQMVPGRDVYLWIDASCAPTATAVQWFLDRLDDAEMAVFRHPERRTIREEYEFMVQRMARPGETYLTSRYQGEWLREQYEHIAGDTSYVDDHLYASTAFIYRPTERVRQALQWVWLAKCRWLMHDQLAFAYALTKGGCAVNVIEENYLRCDALTFTRTRR